MLQHRPDIPEMLYEQVSLIEQESDVEKQRAFCQCSKQRVFPKLRSSLSLRRSAVEP